jgi:hydroxypyruvate isomerase
VQIADPAQRNEPNLQQHPEMLQALLYLLNTHYLGSIGCEYKPAAKFEQGLKFLVILQQAGLCTTPEHTSCT